MMIILLRRGRTRLSKDEEFLMSKNWTDGLDGLLSRPHIALSFVHALQIAEANTNCAHNYRRAPHFGLYAHV